MVHRFMGSSVYLPLRTLLSNVCSSVLIRGSQVWQFARALSGDDTYERYLERQHKNGVGEGVLSRAEFYCQGLERKYARPSRCC